MGFMAQALHSLEDTVQQLIERRAQPVWGRQDSAVLYDLAYTTCCGYC